jgi:hypothetical protein
MSLANEASLLLIPSGYKSGKVYSVFPTDGDGDFTFTRGSDGTRVGAGGLIETMSSNIPRLDYSNSDCPSLLLQPQRTNIVYPNTSISVYSIFNGSKSDNVIISPDGENNGSLVESNGGGTCVIYRSFGTSTNTTYNISVFLKKGNYNNIRLQEGFTSSQMVVDLSNGTEVSSNNATNKKIEDYGNGWYRVSFNYTSHPSTGIAQYSVYINGSTASGNTFYTFGGQIEQGSYPTSYIKTTSGSVTRLKDVCINGGDADLFNSVEGVIFAEFKNHTELGSFRQINLRLNSTNRIYISKRSDNARLEFRMENPLGQKSHSFIQNTSDDFVKIAFRYAPNNFAVFINGVNKNISSSGNTFASGTLSTLEFASPISNQNFYGKVKDLRIYNEPLTNQQLTELTTL